MTGQVGQHEVVLIATDSSGSSVEATIQYDLGGKQCLVREISRVQLLVLQVNTLSFFL